MHYEVNINGRNIRLDIEKTSVARANTWTCTLDGREVSLDAVVIAPDWLSLVIEGRSYDVRRDRSGDTHNVYLGGAKYEVVLRDARSLRNRRRPLGADSGPLQLKASMPGKVVRIVAREGEMVHAGQGLIVVEAMKMQNELRSPKDGVLKKLIVREGANVNAGEVLAVLE